MLIVFMCFDKPGHLDLRLKTRAEHLAWIGNSDNLMYAGPMLADDGQTPVGSLILAEFDSVEAARIFQTDDPYHRVGLFERVIVHATRKVLPVS